MSSRTPKASVESKTIRVLVTYPTPLHQALKQMAERKKVSPAWVVRDATERYAAEEPKSNTHLAEKK